MADDFDIEAFIASLLDSEGRVDLEKLYAQLTKFDPVFQKSVTELRKRVDIFRREERLYEFAATEERIRIIAENKIKEIRGRKNLKTYEDGFPRDTLAHLESIKEIIGDRPNNGRTSFEARVRVTSWPILVRNQSVLLQVSLPRHDQGEYQTWDVVNGESHVQLKAGSKPDKNNRLISGKLPWGKFPRLLLFYINTRVNSHREQNVYLGESVGQFFDRLGLSRQGYTYDSFYEQLDRLVRCGLVIGYHYADSGFPDAEMYPFSKEGTRTIYHQISTQVDELKGLKHQKGLRVLLEDSFYQSILDNPLDIDLSSIRDLGKNLLAMDIYALLAERLPRIEEGMEEEISREDLVNLFGSGQEDKGKFFRESFKTALLLVQEKAYKTANFRLEKNSLVLLYSPPANILPKDLPPLL